MGNKLFGVDIAGALNTALGPLLPSMTLTKVLPGTRSASDPSAGTQPTSRAYPCKGILDTYRTSQIDQTIVKQGDRKALLLGDSLPSGVVPAPGDTVTAEGAVFTVVAVERDPDAATYTCQVRG